jgi:hypothetical protein
LLHRNFRKVAGAIPVLYYHTVDPPAVNVKQLTEKHARLQWLFDNGMKCDGYVTWGACIANDIETLKRLVADKQCKIDER